MLAYHHIANAADPESRHHLQQVSEARAAAVYAAWKTSVGALGAVFRGVAERIRRARRANQTYRELSTLSDYELKDIGLTRGEVAGIAQAIATAAPDSNLTIAGLRQAQLGDATAAEARTAAISHRDNRPRRPEPQAARQPKTAFAKGGQATA